MSGYLALYMKASECRNALDCLRDVLVLPEDYQDLDVDQFLDDLFGALDELDTAVGIVSDMAAGLDEVKEDNRENSDCINKSGLTLLDPSQPPSMDVEPCEYLGDSE